MNIRKTLALLIIGGSAAGIALAQDPPARVARLNLIDGQVSFQPASLDTWAPATLNYPLTTGDHIYTDAASRAEMHVGPNAIRLNAQTNFGFLNLDDRTAQMRFTEGSMEIRVKGLSDQDIYEVDTPNGAVSLLRAGDYRIDTDPDRNATMVTVYAGDAEVNANGQSYPVHPRQTAFFAEGAQPDVKAANPPDDFDRFTMDRNMREDRIPPPQHLPPGMVGNEDMNAYGAWRETPDYGWVWAPPVRAGWAPYHEGHWAWVAPWGWTWIDDAPWGFAPFHYGRWAFAGGGWVWVPGPVAVRPIYAPALVAFVGGPGFRVGIGIGGGGIGAVAWFPLGPREVFQPAYAVSPAYVRNVNVTNVTNVNVTNVRYVNQTVPGAVTAVPQNAFVGARSVAQASQPVTPQQMAQAQVIGHAPQVAPQAQSVMGSSVAATAGRVPQPSAGIMSRQVVAQATPPPPPVSFQSQQAALAQNQGRPLAPEQVAQIRQQQPAAVVNQAPVRPSTAVIGSRLGGSQPNTPPSGNSQPSTQPPANRLDSRPPGARPLSNAPAPAPAATAARTAPEARTPPPAPAARTAPTPPAPAARKVPPPKKKEKEEERR
jgi:hypothetical protein